MAAFRAEWATPEYWLAFAPSLHVASGHILRRGLVPFCTDEAPAALRAALAADGFFQLAPPEDCGLFDDGGGWGVDVAALGDAVVALGEAGWPPIYVLVYDEAWVLRGRLAHTLRGAADLAVNFDFAAFHVKAGGNAQTLAAGWAPHRDRDDAAHVGGAVADALRGGRRRAARAAPGSRSRTRRRRRPASTACPGPATRATRPATAAGRRSRPASRRGPRRSATPARCRAPMGGVLAFSHRLLHWGSAPDAGAPPRVAVAFGAGSETSPPGVRAKRGGPSATPGLSRRAAASRRRSASASPSPRPSCSASFTPSSRLLFSPDIPHSSNNALQPVGDVTSSYDGDSVCVVSEHGSLSAGCGQRVFQRAAVDTRRAHAAAHHPLA
ncbi:hypothetical protein SO694_00061144 [Aureococcus anophagefferens]|uniref:Uncharacterized protein n=1 Tax=Aureococcus anophagefferens TaxID=44056 RepID=A0ABR1FRA2_AURAN